MNVPRIQSVKPLQDYRLLVTFVNGVQKFYNCNQIINLEPFRLLKEEAFFNTIMVDVGGYGISWNDEADLSEYELWHNGIELVAEDKMNVEQLIENSRPFLAYIVDWQTKLPAISLTQIINGNPNQVAIISVDVINGFCYEGALASPRVAKIVDPIVTLFQKSYQAGMRHFILTQDTHPADAVEFANFPPHCLRGTRESEAVDKFKELSFFDQFQVIPKLSLNSVMGTDLEAWLAVHSEVNTFITVGDCTDLCIYQLAMHLKLRANVRNEKVRIILPVDCVETYDLPVDVAQEIGAIPHHGDLLHTIFLYHMMLNGIEVVAKID